MFLDLIILCWVLAPDFPLVISALQKPPGLLVPYCIAQSADTRMVPEHTTGRRLHLILLPDQEVHSRHPQYHDIGWASNPDLWTLSWFITHLQAELPAYSALSHKGLAILPCYHPFLAILPCASMDCSIPVIRAIPPLPCIMMRP